MKKPFLFLMIFCLLLFFTPNYVHGVTNESVCKSTSKDYVAGVGYVLNQQKYEECIDRYEKQEFWRNASRWGVGIFLIIAIGSVGVIAFRNISKRQPVIENNTIDYSWTPPVRKGWTPDQKEQVRIRQDGKCAHCQKPPPRWEYHHKNGNRSDNSLDNCEGLCPNCHSVETHEG